MIDRLSIDPVDHGVIVHHPTLTTQPGQNGASSSAANVIPTEKLAHGLSVAKGIFASIGSRARKSLEDLNETPAMQKVCGNGRAGPFEWVGSFVC